MFQRLELLNGFILFELLQAYERFTKWGLSVSSKSMIPKIESVGDLPLMQVMSWKKSVPGHSDDMQVAQALDRPKFC